MTSKVRIALIGAGQMGTEHIRNIALLDTAEVVAIADPNEGSRVSMKVGIVFFHQRFFYFLFFYFLK
jgi:predicted homoserine dehydrogenase-like protein